jgi:hypothetical protein
MHFAVEQALPFFMEAGCELPDGALVLARRDVEGKAFDRVVELVKRLSGPTTALRGPIRGEDD